MRVLNFGSINIDLVYQVEHIVRPGETISSLQRQTHAGGKGANQSVALARAGVKVFHAGRHGSNGRWLRERLESEGVDVSFLETDEDATGEAVIQVERHGQNSIVLYPGANRKITRDQIQRTLEHFGPGDTLLLQNEINDVGYLMEAGQQQGLTLCFNPAPMDAEVLDYPLALLDLLVLNQSEGAALSGKREPDAMIHELNRRYPKAEIILTLGEAGVWYKSQHQRFQVPAIKVQAVDTTAAGDTFIGFFLAGKAMGMSIASSLSMACRASALCVTRSGAMDSIPCLAEIESL